MKASLKALSCALPLVLAACAGDGTASKAGPSGPTMAEAFYALPVAKARLSDGDRLYIRLDPDRISGLAGSADRYDGSGDATTVLAYRIVPLSAPTRSGDIVLRLDPGTTGDDGDDATLRGRVENGRLVSGTIDPPVDEGSDSEPENLDFTDVAPTRVENGWLPNRAKTLGGFNYYVYKDYDAFGWYGNVIVKMPSVTIHSNWKTFRTADQAVRLATESRGGANFEVWAAKYPDEWNGRIDVWWGSMCFRTVLTNNGGPTPSYTAYRTEGAEGKAWRNSTWGIYRYAHERAVSFEPELEFYEDSIVGKPK